MSIETMKQALEAWQTSVYGSERHHKAMLMAMTNMGQVIAEAEKQEPVAHMYPDDLEKFQTEETFAYAYSVEMGSPTKGNTVPLYDRPQPKRYVATPREPLTDEQIDYSIKKNDIVTSKSWSLTELIVVDVNWALGAVAVQLGYGGGIVVWPALSLKKEAAHNQRN